MGGWVDGLMKDFEGRAREAQAEALVSGKW